MKLSLYILSALLMSTTCLADFKVHEWGTFTSMQGSDGERLGGLEYEEEKLPPFVHNLNYSIERGRGQCTPNCSQCAKGICMDDFSQADPWQVTQKMEAPVLYFYSEKPLDVSVTVDFPRGLISQYYPLPTAVIPAQKPTAIQSGQIYYANLKVLTETVEVPKVESGNVYGPARETKSNFVQMQNENEKFIFYRGLGNFTSSLGVYSDSNTLSLEDRFVRGIPYILAVNIRNKKGAFKELGGITKPQITKNLNIKTLMAELNPKQDLADFEKSVGPKLVEALTKTGLYKDEAQAMVNTWKLSYFHSEGFRLLYILPRLETDEILPIKISPEPAELVRTLIGRVEVFTADEEKSLVTLVDNLVMKYSGVEQSQTKQLGRFRVPKLLRVKELTQSVETKNAIDNWLKP